MILIACTEYSRHLTQIHLMKEKLTKDNIEVQIHPIISDQKLFNTIAHASLISAIKKAELILLLIQPYPFVDWDDPHDSFYMMIYSFISLLPCAKSKTVYITPFMPLEIRDNIVGISLMKDLFERSKLGHFSIFPNDSKEFLDNPPLMSVATNFPTTSSILLDFYDKLAVLCRKRIKKS